MLASHPPFPIVLNEQKCLGTIRQTVPQRNFTEQSAFNQESTSSYLSPTISLLGFPNKNQKKDVSTHHTAPAKSKASTAAPAITALFAASGVFAV
jgi:hypothetical protein